MKVRPVSKVDTYNVVSKYVISFSMMELTILDIYYNTLTIITLKEVTFFLTR